MLRTHLVGSLHASLASLKCAVSLSNLLSHTSLLCIISSIHPAWPLADGALLVSKGGAQCQTVCWLLHAHCVYVRHLSSMHRYVFTTSQDC